MNKDSLLQIIFSIPLLIFFSAFPGCQEGGDQADDDDDEVK